MDPLTVMQQLGLVPVVEIPRADLALPLAQALVDAGLPSVEITFRTSAAEAAIELIASRFPDMLLGAGTVLSTDQVDRAVSAGARFVVAPGFSPRVVEHCLAKGVPIIPGVSTPTEVEAALARGVTTVKFFPAEAMGGVTYLRAIRAPYRGMRFVPTGGITLDNLPDYLAVDGVIACGGSWVAPKELLAAGDFKAIEKLTAAAVATVERVRADASRVT